MFSIKLIIIWAILVAVKPTRKFALALTPWLVFACSYDGMRLLPNYEVNPIDTRGIYEAEKSLFGIGTAAGTLIPGEWFNLHNCAFADFMAGFFYLCWVPVPLGFAIYLYLKGKREMYLRFSLAFLFVNLVGFVGYYIHPAAPPWYVIEHGFTPVLNTPGSVAGLGRFDSLVGAPVFHSIYCNNSNVFAAVPSLHAAYMLVATIYAIISRQNKLCIGIFAFICMGIWWTAVYSTHHYIIDVLLGILTTIVALLILERLLLRAEWAKRFMARYAKNI
ncbi:MAG: phosphatase PAP2 family protein [Prevotella sp.]|nr:phosphatase PAP2 family protein [Prevotella sp.]